MGIEERLLIGDVLIKEFKKLAEGLIVRPNEDLVKTIRRANSVKVQMYKCYRTWGKPPKLLDQIRQMDEIIKNIEELHNKHV